MPMPGDDVFNAGEELFARLEHMHDLLADPDKTSVRVVLTLEQVVIKEAQRSFTYFHLYNYPTDLVVANRVLPDDQEWHYFRDWYDAQQRYGPLVEKTFRPSRSSGRRCSTARWWACRSSRELAAALYGDEDPTQFFYRGRPYSVSRDNGAFLVSVDLPFTGQDADQPLPPRRRARHRPRHVAPHARPAAHPGGRANRRRNIRRWHPEDPLPSTRPMKETHRP